MASFGPQSYSKSLKSVIPDGFKLKKDASSLISSILYDINTSMINACASNSGNNSITVKHVETAIKNLIPKDIRKFALSAGNGEVFKYASGLITYTAPKKTEKKPLDKKMFQKGLEELASANRRDIFLSKKCTIIAGIVYNFAIKLGDKAVETVGDKSEMSLNVLKAMLQSDLGRDLYQHAVLHAESNLDLYREGNLDFNLKLSQVEDSEEDLKGKTGIFISSLMKRARKEHSAPLSKDGASAMDNFLNSVFNSILDSAADSLMNNTPQPLEVRAADIDNAVKHTLPKGLCRTAVAHGQADTMKYNQGLLKYEPIKPEETMEVDEPTLVIPKFNKGLKNMIQESSWNCSFGKGSMSAINGLLQDFCSALAEKCSENATKRNLGVLTARDVLDSVHALMAGELRNHAFAKIDQTQRALAVTGGADIRDMLLSPDFRNYQFASGKTSKSSNPHINIDDNRIMPRTLSQYQSDQENSEFFSGKLGITSTASEDEEQKTHPREQNTNVPKYWSVEYFPFANDLNRPKQISSRDESSVPSNQIYDIPFNESKLTSGVESWEKMQKPNEESEPKDKKSSKQLNDDLKEFPSEIRSGTKIREPSDQISLAGKKSDSSKESKTKNLMPNYQISPGAKKYLEKAKDASEEPPKETESGAFDQKPSDQNFSGAEKSFETVDDPSKESLNEMKSGSNHQRSNEQSFSGTEKSLKKPDAYYKESVNKLESGTNEQRPSEKTSPDTEKPSEKADSTSKESSHGMESVANDRRPGDQTFTSTKSLEKPGGISKEFSNGLKPGTSDQRSNKHTFSDTEKSLPNIDGYFNKSSNETESRANDQRSNESTFSGIEKSLKKVDNSSKASANNNHDKQENLQPSEKDIYSESTSNSQPKYGSKNNISSETKLPSIPEAKESIEKSASSELKKQSESDSINIVKPLSHSKSEQNADNNITDDRKHSDIDSDNNFKSLGSKSGENSELNLKKGLTPYSSEPTSDNLRPDSMTENKTDSQHARSEEDGKLLPRKSNNPSNNNAKNAEPGRRFSDFVPSFLSFFTSGSSNNDNKNESPDENSRVSSENQSKPSKEQNSSKDEKKHENNRTFEFYHSSNSPPILIIKKPIYWLDVRPYEM